MRASLSLSLSLSLSRSSTRFSLLFFSSLQSSISSSVVVVLLQVFRDSRFGCSVYTLCLCLKFDLKLWDSVAASDLRF